MLTFIAVFLIFLLYTVTTSICMHKICDMLFRVTQIRLSITTQNKSIRLIWGQYQYLKHSYPLNFGVVKIIFSVLELFSEFLVYEINTDTCMFFSVWLYAQSIVSHVCIVMSRKVAADSYLIIRLNKV